MAKTRTKDDLSRRRDYAQLLFVNQKLTQKEIALKTGISEVTISKWAKAGKWDGLRKTISVTREERMRSTIDQLTDLDNLIASREEKYCFPSKDESNIRRRLVADLASLENECGLTDVINVSIKLLEWLRPIDPEKAKEISHIFDGYIKDQLR
jgi:transcriptional regulator with XRE-family HTH domain